MCRGREDSTDSAHHPLRRLSAGVSLSVVSLVIAAAAGTACTRWLRADPPDILLISIDTLRPDHLEAYGYPRETSPTITSIASSGLVGEEVVTPLPATDPAHASMLTGLHPLRHGVMTNAVPLPPEIETLPQVLSRHGYHTIGAIAVAHLGRDYGFDRGFAAFSDVEGAGIHERTADEVNGSVFDLLERAPRGNGRPPLFLFVHYFDVHRPYLLREHGRVIETSGAAESLIKGYDSEISFVDDHIRQLLQRLGQLRLARKLLICITSDHGEQFGEHDFTGGHADFYRETHRVALLLAGPGVRRGRLKHRTSLMDIPVTLAAAAGATFSGAVDGLDLLHPDAASAEARLGRSFLVVGYPSHTRSIQVIEGDWSFIRNLDRTYRTMSLEPLRRVDPPALLRAGFREVPRASAGTPDCDEYQIALPDLEPRWVSVVLEAAGCPARVSLQLDPRLSYLDEPADIGRGVRLTFPMARFDRAAVLVSPRGCDPRVLVKMDGNQAPAQGESSRLLEVALYRRLLTTRRFRPGDELYQLRSDPGMETNRWRQLRHEARAKQLQLTLRQAYRQRTSKRVDWTYSQRESEMLRSLGYIQ